MHGVFIEKVGEIALKEIPVPAVADDEVLIKVQYAGICGSDLHVFSGRHAFRKPPVIPGHEMSGVVVEIGFKVSNVSVGDRVTIMPMLACGSCSLCGSGFENHCRKIVVPGTPAWTGTFVEYMNAAEKVVFRIPGQVSSRAAVIAEPLSIAIHALEKIPLERRKSLLIMGAGTIGILSLVAARKTGFGHIAVTDIVDFNLGKARELGADETINVSRETTTGTAPSCWSREYSGIIIAASSPEIFDQAFTAAAVGATIVHVSMITEKISLNPRPIVEKELSVVGSRRCRRTDFQKALDMISGAGELFGSLATHCFGWRESQHAFDMMMSRSEGHIKVLVNMESR